LVATTIRSFGSSTMRAPVSRASWRATRDPATINSRSAYHYRPDSRCRIAKVARHVPIASHARRPLPGEAVITDRSFDAMCQLQNWVGRAKHSQMNDQASVTLWRPVGPKELDLIRQSGMRLSPRLPEQPIFYPVLTESYAVKIARDWNVPASGKGYVTRFRVAGFPGS
jgi:hypothetical protein